MTTVQKLGWGLSGLFGLFMIFASALPKLTRMAVASDIMAQLGWPDAPLMLIGALEVVLTLLYLFPPTAVLGASLLMALLGGAIVTNLHGNAELFGHTLFGIYIGVLMWAGLILRDPRVRGVFPLDALKGYQPGMETPVDCVLEDERWETLSLAALADRAATATLTALALPPSQYAICVMGCDDTRIAALNAEFRAKPTPTNVLSWPAEDLAPDAEGEEPYLPGEGDPADPLTLGDIALAWETCEREAREADKPMADHVTHLVVHGLLHCLGYDHVRDGDAARMEGLEVQILASLGLPDPY